MKYQYDLVLGLPHTNHNGLADHLLLAHAGHLQWTSIARAVGTPLSKLRTASGAEVYATFYFIEERFPESAPISTFALDDELRFGVFLRAFKNLAVEGHIVFDRRALVEPLLDRCGERWPGDEGVSAHPTIRFGNIFITPDAGNSALRVAPPANANFSRLPSLPNDENPYQITKAAEESGELGLIDMHTWQPVAGEAAEVRYTIDVDRDTNGAGLVYFANYVAFMESAERQAMQSGGFTYAQAVGRSLLRRRLGYYGNAAVDDTVRTRVSLFRHRHDARRIAARFAMYRESDDRLVCRAETIKVLPFDSIG